jgi:hypothetical protein
MVTESESDRDHVGACTISLSGPGPATVRVCSAADSANAVPKISRPPGLLWEGLKLCCTRSKLSVTFQWVTVRDRAPRAGAPQQAKFRFHTN